MNLPEKWSSYIKDINRWKLDGFEKKVKQFKAKTPNNAKEPLRLTDTMAGAESPLKFTQKQLAMQFYEGTNCLLKSGVSVLPCNPKKDTRVVLETFPDLVAQRFAVHDLGARLKSVDIESLHKEIIKGLKTPEFERDFKFKIFLDDTLKLKFGGTGLGLAINRRFCLMMGGDITVKSVEGEGSTFTIEMPVKVVLETALRRRASDR